MKRKKGLAILGGSFLLTGICLVAIVLQERGQYGFLDSTTLGPYTYSCGPTSCYTVKRYFTYRSIYAIFANAERELADCNPSRTQRSAHFEKSEDGLNIYMREWTRDSRTTDAPVMIEISQRATLFDRIFHPYFSQTLPSAHSYISEASARKLLADNR